MIFVSAGHHPAAPGATHERFTEYDEAIIWAEKLVELLGDEGMLVPTGVLQSKVDYINSRLINGDIALEIHFNAAADGDGNPVGRGSETLYYPGSAKGEALATAVQAALADVFPPDRGVKEGWYRMDPNRGPDFFLKRTKCPAVILEPEFVHRNDIIIEKRDEAVEKLAIVLSEYE